MKRQRTVGVAIVATWVLLSAATALPACPLRLIFEADGNAVLTNASSDVIAWDAYEISSTNGELLPANWQSLADQVVANPGAAVARFGNGVLGTTELFATAESLSEANLSSVVLMLPGEHIQLGHIFNGTLAELVAARDGGHLAAVARYRVGEQGPLIESNIITLNLAEMDRCAPEPSTMILGLIALVGLLAGCNRSRFRAP